MRKFILVIIALVLLTPLLAASGIGVSLVLENQDSFCAACHTQPESQYYAQALAKNPGTLAAYHAQKKIACIDCHSGGGALGRMSGLQQGAHDLTHYLSGNYNKPAVTTNPLGDDACLKCHAKVAQKLSRGTSQGATGHYHYYLAQWQAVDSQAAHCATCHTAHTPQLASLQYITQGKAAQQCDGCHTALSGKIK